MIQRLLEAMKARTKVVKPQALGIIGKEHLAARFEEIGCEMESYQYKRVLDITDGLPCVVETAFGWCPGNGGRRLVTGVNWSPGILNPFRALGRHGDSLDSILSDQYADRDEPVVVRYTWRAHGSSTPTAASPPSRWRTEPMDSSTIFNAVRHVTRTWHKQRRDEDRRASAALRRRDAMTRTRRVTVKEVAWEVIQAAYLKASDNGKLPAHARQIMYAARPAILGRTGEDRLDDQYFCQTLLPDYMAEHADETADWDVAFDARGHFEEPHTELIVPLGTLEVRDIFTRSGRTPYPTCSSSSPS